MLIEGLSPTTCGAIQGSLRNVSVRVTNYTTWILSQALRAYAMRTRFRYSHNNQPVTIICYTQRGYDHEANLKKQSMTFT